MQNVKSIRERLGVTQKSLAAAMGCSQGNIANYESGQTLGPHAASKLIAFARARGLEIGFDHIYSDKPLPDLAQTASLSEKPRNDRAAQPL